MISIKRKANIKSPATKVKAGRTNRMNVKVRRNMAFRTATICTRSIMAVSVRATSH